MRNSTATLVNPASPVSTPVASEVVRDKVRERGITALDLSSAAAKGDTKAAIRLSEDLAAQTEELRALFAHPASTIEDRECVAAALR